MYLSSRAQDFMIMTSFRIVFENICLHLHQKKVPKYRDPPPLPSYMAPTPLLQGYPYSHREHYCDTWLVIFLKDLTLLKTTQEKFFAGVPKHSGKKSQFQMGKKLLSGNTWASSLCIMKEYKHRTISMIQYHTCLKYHDSMSIS